MRAGRLDQRIELQSPTNTPNGQGGFDTEHTVQATVWANVRPMSGRERSHSDQLQAEGGYIVTIRNQGQALNLNETWRLRWVNQDCIFNIRFIEQSGTRAQHLPIQCDSGVAT